MEILEETVLKVQEITEEAVDTNIVTEEVETDNGKKKNYYIEGVFMQAEIKNGNRRIYPKKVLTEAVNDYMPRIKANRGYGELGHPTDPGIHLNNVCMLTQILREEGNNFYGKAKILTETSAGKIVKNLIDEGASFGVSSRGRGGIKNGIVQNGFSLVTPADIVADPSAPEAFVTSIVENKEWIMSDGVLMEQDMEALREDILKEKKKTAKEIEVETFSRFLKLLKSV